MSTTEYVIEYEGLYVGYDGDTAADGYRYLPLGKALRFKSPEECANFMDVSGPPWLIEYAKKGLMHMRPVVDGVVKR